jgi:hypothetical protein
VDYFKIVTNHYPSIELIKASKDLNFFAKFDEDTGEVIYSVANFKNIVFVHYPQTQKYPHHRFYIKGSLHKYWNDGKHNYNDFNKTSLNLTYSEFINRFKINAYVFKLLQIEIGVNIQPSKTARKIVECCLLFKLQRSYKSVECITDGYYKQARLKRHINKIYDKGTHYRSKGHEITKEILRIERKYIDVNELRNHLDLKTFADLPQLDFQLCKKILIDLWNEVVFYDWTVIDGTKYEHQYSSIISWLKLKKDNFYYHKNNLNRLISDESYSLKSEISNLIKNKVDELQTTRLGDLVIAPESVVTRCIVTGLDISMQKEDSFLLSHSGLKHYMQNNVEVYDEIKFRFLSKKWKNSNAGTQIKEIAHNIRNTINNQRIKQDLLYPVWQSDLKNLMFSKL